MNQVELNQQIEKFIESHKGQAITADERDFVLQYEGSGGQGSKGAKGEGVLYEFFTPDFIVDLMWDLAYRHGFKDTETVLEPSCGTGRLLIPAKDYKKCYGFEINPISTEIARMICKGSTIYNGYFETAFLQPPRYTVVAKKTWVEGYPFGLVLGNPPYGIYQNTYSGFFNKKLFKQIEIFFIYKALELLKSGGLLIYLISSNFMSNGNMYTYAKNEIGKIAELTDAYRIGSVFKFSKVPTDIIVIRKK